ncbi:aminoglycoside phosphotransferase [Meridianimarinicoccus roseus]|uniref:Aminoglycoside phosphotransferase n=1 Tax=Meridianimarinicoccus roseus TaxID=2072018 RepID=A0A2V2LIB0_9RHOB|nr:aminoglycoside phosphotransferase [Meridianimarinicoccus roseus]
MHALTADADTSRRAFLGAAGWGAATSVPLAGDASARRYERLTNPDGRRAVLMIAPPAPDDSTGRFCIVAAHLAGLGLSVPTIHAAAPEDGLALMEDLGDAVFAREITRDATCEAPLYTAAIDMLAELHRHPAPTDLAAPDAAQMAAMIAPAADWYAGRGRARPDLARAFASALAGPLEAALDGPRVLAHRDFHAENLIWLPQRRGVAQVGLLDFQDAFAGPPAYDLVSLLEDARRDLAPGLAEAMRERYSEATGTPPEALARDLSVLGAQRNLRILGIFARLCLHFGKPRYVDLIPRVRAHLDTDLAHPDLAALRALTDAHLPAPTPDLLEELKSRCLKIPTP